MHLQQIRQKGAVAPQSIALWRSSMIGWDQNDRI